MSPETSTIISKSHILIQNEKIVYVGHKNPKIKGSYSTINAKDKYIIPGLIDSHGHISNVHGLSEDDEVENPELVREFQK